MSESLARLAETPKVSRHQAAKGNLSQPAT